MPRWTDPRHLVSYWDDAPLRPGVYEIGFYRIEFRALYVGKAEGQRGILGRIAKHADESHNEHIFGYCATAQRNNLYFRWQVVEDARQREALLLTRRGIGRDGGQYVWNKRMETPW